MLLKVLVRYLIILILANSALGLISVKIDSEKRVCVNDTPFFPIGLYSVPLDSLEAAKALGFNMVHSYIGEGATAACTIGAVKHYLDVAESLGLNAFIGLPRPDIINQDSVKLVDRIKVLQSSKSLLAWYLYDEPYNPLHQPGTIPSNVIAASSRYIKQFDSSSRPTVIVHCLVTTYETYFTQHMEYFNCADIIMPDPYPVTSSGSDLSPVYNDIVACRRITSNTKPIWDVIQLHGSGAGGTGYGLLEPTYAQLRNMVYQSLVAGVRGLTFWAYTSGEFNLPKTTQGMANVRKITAEISKLSPILLADNPSTINLSPGNSIVRTRELHLNGKTFLFAVNMTYAAQSLTVKANTLSRVIKSITRLSDSVSLPIVSESLTESIEALGVRLYEIQLDSVAEPVLDSVRLSSHSRSFFAGDSIKLSAMGYFHRGTVTLTSMIDTVSYQVTGSGVVTASNGLVKGLTAGTASVFVVVNGVGDSCKVNVYTKTVSLARGKTVTASSTLESADWGAAKLVDGTLISKPTARGFTTNCVTTNPVSAWVRIDLGSDLTFNHIVLYPRVNSETPTLFGGSPTFPTDFTLQATPDGGTAQTIMTVKNYSNTDKYPLFLEFPATKARYIQLNATVFGSDGNCFRMQLAEFEVFNSGSFTGTATLPSTPDESMLTIVPNPFNPSTLIRYHFANTTDASFSIYDCRGQLVRQWLLVALSGRCSGSFKWDGKDYQKRHLASGLYVGILKSTNGLTLSNKILLAR
ncbi:MAG: discoidin domain-containing protein [Fibrobacteres bacterium]|nr:discoidin domain-containing protein [Fibrobacterota bacterium]